MRQGKTIVLPFASPQSYKTLVVERDAFRQELCSLFTSFPQLFPEHFEQGFHFCGTLTSRKTGLVQRRLRLIHTKQTYQLRPSFVMPYMTAMTEEVENALFLRRWGVPFWR